MQNDLRGLGQGPYIEANLKGKIIYRRQFYKQGKHVDVLMVDELSFVSSDMLDRIDQHLRLARDMPYIPFGGLHVVFIGDLYQLPPPGGLPIFASKLWPLFELCELDGNQRAARDPAWAALLARVRVGQWTQEDIQTLESMILKKYGNRKPAAGAVHLVATRRAVADGNRACLQECVESAHAEMLECPAVDISVNACTLLPPGKAWPLSEDTGGLEALLGLAVDMPVMLRKNMDVQDGLVNGARGVVQHIDVHESGEVQKIWVKFEKDAGSRWQRNNQCASVAIQRCTFVSRQGRRQGGKASVPLGFSQGRRNPQESGCHLPRRRACPAGCVGQTGRAGIRGLEQVSHQRPLHFGALRSKEPALQRQCRMGPLEVEGQASAEHRPKEASLARALARSHPAD